MTDLFKMAKVLADPAAAAAKEAALMERALVFVDAAKRATFLAGYGFGIECDVEGLGDPREFGVAAAAPEEPGLWRWDGTPFWVEERSEGVLEGCVPEYVGHDGKSRGTWRRLTPEEGARILAGDLSDFTETQENFDARHHDG